MKDRIQRLASMFSNKFGFMEVRIPFAEAFTRADLNLYNWLLTPTTVLTPSEKRHEENMIKLMNRLEERERYAALKDYLWREIIESTKFRGFVSEIEARDVRILRAAISIADGKNPIIENKEELKVAQGIAERIKRFHAKGKAIKEFKDVLRLATQETGKLPLVDVKSSDLENYLHEAIHYILRANRLWFSANNRFNEGLCTYLHMRWRGIKTYRLYYFPTGNAKYRHWSRFFSDILHKTPDLEVYNTLKRNIQYYLTNFKLWETGNLRTKKLYLPAHPKGLGSAQ